MFARQSKSKAAYGILTAAAAFSILATAVGLLAGRHMHGAVVPRYVFVANLVTGAFFVGCGIGALIMPRLEKKGPLEDASTYVEMSSDRREAKRRKGHVFLWLGFAVGLIGALAEMALWHAM